MMHLVSQTRSTFGCAWLVHRQSLIVAQRRSKNYDGCQKLHLMVQPGSYVWTTSLQHVVLSYVMGCQVQAGIASSLLVAFRLR